MDRNKSTLTHEVTAAATAWLDERGFKPIETEVPVAPGWCADLASVIVPTQTELIDLKLLERCPSWNEIHSRARKRRVWDEERYEAWRQKRDSMMRLTTCLVEIKVTRNDFRGDRKWSASKLPTDIAFLVVPKGLIREEEWPAGWGILEYSDGTIRRLRVPSLNYTTAEQQLGIVHSIAQRRDSHTRYERWREFQRDQRSRENEDVSRLRLSDAIRCVMDILHGRCESVEDALRGYKVKRPSSYLIEQLRPHLGTLRGGK